MALDFLNKKYLSDGAGRPGEKDYVHSICVYWQNNKKELWILQN